MNIKTFSIHSVRNVLAVVIALGLGYVAYTVNPTSVAPTKVEAGASQNVSGWAWSENIGWISLNSLDCDTDKNGYTDSGACGGNNTSTIARDYGVNISPLSGTGIFSGSAWSENVGWITFNSGELAGCPSGTCNAQVDWVSGKVTGWARVLSQTGDGWIKLGGDGLSWGGSSCTGVSDNANTNRCNYGVKITSGKFSGYAWGSDSIGWVDFSPSVGGLPVNSMAQISGGVCTATIINSGGGTWGACDATASCESGGQVIQTELEGTRIGYCDGIVDPIVDPTCVAPSTDCSGYAASHPGTYIVGDGTCNPPSENLTNSPIDCKPKTKFWQF